MKFRLISVLVVILLVVIDLGAQCPMCRMAAESNLDHGGTAGKGLNTGILYMLSLPYIMVAVIGYIWVKNRKTDIDHLESDLQSHAKASTSA